ncbi:hypothetical protein NLU13_7440 [Sarocladium strictum]|uniref:GPI anchored protein n=1 Tax=Sarocladium strictum TaxID=5046 RepID=A0AA39L5K5_SARSR|nr:hypothetical protein NLU13_7440 [Sarocladium strictum]
MRSPQSISPLPLSLLALALHSVSAQQNLPTAIRRQAPDAGAKILPEHLAFAPINLYIPEDILSLDEDPDTEHTKRLYHPAFRSVHDGGAGHNVFRRAAEALSLLEPRQACFAGMNSCAAIGKPLKCCQDGTYCQDVPDASLGEVACCPVGSTCAGSAKCPSDAVTCPESLGGGCCLSGFECQGSICVPVSSSPPSPSTTTEVQTRTNEESAATVTRTRTTMIEGNPSTVVVTLTVTRTAEPKPETRTVTQEITESLGAPYRPTSSSATSKEGEGGSTTTQDEENTTEPPEPTQTGCPTGFYGCLATHGGGCCRTDRNCETHDCPAQASTTVVSDGQTIVVPAGGVAADASATCADGWFLCGRDAGPRAGCCPSGYSCGTASCFTVEASQTGAVQKELPETDGTAGLTVGFGELARLAMFMTSVLLMT